MVTEPESSFGPSTKDLRKLMGQGADIFANRLSSYLDQHGVDNMSDLAKVDPNGCNTFSEVLVESLPPDSGPARTVEFLSDVSHEFRSPLTYTRGYLSILLDAYKDDHQDFPADVCRQVIKRGDADTTITMTEDFVTDEIIPIADILANNRSTLAMQVGLDSFYRQIMGKDSVPPFGLNTEALVGLGVTKMLASIDAHRPKLEAYFHEHPTVNDKVLRARKAITKGLDTAVETLKFHYGDYSGEFFMEPEEVDISQFINERQLMVNESVLKHVYKGLKSKEKDAEVEVAINNQSGIEKVNVDRALFSAVWKNLLENVLKYGYNPQTGRRNANITVTRQDSMVKFAVADNGDGMTPQASARVFERNYRAPEARDKPGTGLGLAICKKVVEKWGGKIEVTSPGLGQGSTFIFTLPLVK
jgi:signal transduction histidine kinase